MTTALTPALALAYLEELSVDVRDAVVLGADGEPLAGDAALAARVRELLAARADAATAPAPGVRMVPVADGTLLAAGTAGGFAIGVLAGPRALLGLLGHDLARIAEALAAPADPSR